MMKTTISARLPKNEKKNRPADLTASVQVNWVDVDKDAEAALKEAVALVGAKALLTNAFANWRVTVQGNIRAGLDKGEKQEQIQARLADCKMGVAVQGAARDSEADYLAKFASATPEEQAKMIERLKQKAAGK